ncbi:MAG TPA: serine hydrolase, partial [Candidatus Atribacteria bacterium]|nr:serine hydrolase [Candidatus Atribacteria bacterium]
MNKHVYKYYSIFIALVFVFFSLTNTALADMPPFEVSAKSAILMDYGTGEILYEKNPHEKLPIASLTKIMTLLLALESIDQGKLKLEDKVVVSEHAASMGGSQVFLHEGEVLTVDAIMKAIIVASGNDASVALAEKIAGTHEVFVKKMNEKAQALGMKNTNFVNATGLPA